MLKFLKPSLFKIVVALALFLGLTWMWSLKNMFIMDASFYGAPLIFFSVWGPCQIGQTCSDFNGINLLLDLIFWYLVCAFIVERFSKKKQQPM
jgi:hypothetical protein